MSKPYKRFILSYPKLKENGWEKEDISYDDGREVWTKNVYCGHGTIYEFDLDVLPKDRIFNSMLPDGRIIHSTIFFCSLKS